MTAASALERSAEEQAAGVREGAWTAQALVEASIQRTRAVDDALGGFLSLRPEVALEAAAAVDAARRRGESLPALAGVPVAAKDNLVDRGGTATCASRILEGFVPSYDATALARLRAAGAILTGKTNLDEFAMGSSTENSAFFPSRNPWDPARVPGGSSGGSAVAVASGQVPLALGSDTGGSVRQPGSFCGLVALKPQYGAVSRHGLVAFASSLDVVGPMARTARDCALLFDAVRGHDPRDATSRAGMAPFDSAGLERPLGATTLGVPRAWLESGLDEDVRTAFEATCRRFADLGTKIVDVELLSPRYAISTYYVVANAEASSNLARFDGVRYGRRAAAPDLHGLYERSRGEGFGREVKRRILLGTFVLSSGYYDAYYAKAQAARGLLRRSFEDALARVDAILTPTAPTPAFRIGEKLADPMAMYLSDVFTITANLVQIPAVSFPAGISAQGLPIGMQLMGRPDGEERLLQLVRAHERQHDGAGSAASAGSPIRGEARRPGAAA